MNSRDIVQNLPADEGLFEIDADGNIIEVTDADLIEQINDSVQEQIDSTRYVPDTDGRHYDIRQEDFNPPDKE